jgi:hypothetical protein
MAKKQPEVLSHPWENWVPMRILRSQIRGAEYNPRTISDSGRRRLKSGMKKLHLLQPLVWNVRSGVLVGGHQRLEILDRNAGGAKDYYLTVAQVDLSEADEVAANLLLNNQEAGGEVDVAKLRAVFDRHPNLDLGAAGYERVDVLRLFGMAKAEVATASELAEMGESLDKMRDLADRIAETSRKRDDGLFYVVLIFRDSDESIAFVEHLKLRDDQFQSAADVLGAIREHGLPVQGEN